MNPSLLRGSTPRRPLCAPHWPVLLATLLGSATVFAGSAQETPGQNPAPPTPPQADGGRKEKGKSPVAEAERVLQEGVDLFVERMVRKGQAIDDRDWASAMGASREVIERARKLVFLQIGKPDYAKLPGLVADKVKDADLFPDPKRVVARTVSATAFAGSFILCNGEVETDGAGIADAVIFANGKIKIATTVHRCVLICDDDVEIGAGVGHSVIIARGNIRVVASLHDTVAHSAASIDLPQGHALRSHLAAQRDVSIFGYAERGTLLAGGTVTCDSPRDSTVVRSKVKELPKILSFSGTELFGVAVEQVQGQIMVVRAASGGPFDRAGVATGDVIITVDADPVRSVGTFRRLLRQAVARGSATFSVRRAGKVSEFSVKFSSR